MDGGSLQASALIHWASVRLNHHGRIIQPSTGRIESDPKGYGQSVVPQSNIRNLARGFHNQRCKRPTLTAEIWSGGISLNCQREIAHNRISGESAGALPRVGSYPSMFHSLLSRHKWVCLYAPAWLYG